MPDPNSLCSLADFQGNYSPAKIARDANSYLCPSNEKIDLIKEYRKIFILIMKILEIKVSEMVGIK